MDRRAKAQALGAVAEILGELGELNAEIQRRREMEGAVEFVGRTDMGVTGYYEGKAGKEEGILIEGVAAAWTQDREDEFFAKGAFDRSIDRFLNTNPILVYSHSRPVTEEVHITDGGKAATPSGRQSGYLQLGVVREMWKDARGLMARAWFPKPAADSHPIIKDAYDKVKKGYMKGLSIGAKFKQLAGMIIDADIQELSIAPKPIHPDALITKVTPGSIVPNPA